MRIPRSRLWRGEAGTDLGSDRPAVAGGSVPVLVTRVDADKAGELLAAFPAGDYNQIGKTFRLASESVENKSLGRVTVVTAGTSDLPVAEEAKETAGVDGRRGDDDPRCRRGGAAPFATAH